ncbi:tetratricopeptide repeat-containing response regulator [Flocculibacter collagenilyticus]|uniref:tetratricopeptide repeat-containing response regulator n=1 Tax=Flocculibacter collagenilyticus TaxID=2744479 RepID=UPI0018F467BA|nr:tetratricopeptide repeat-containing response regulator [Flocculibacter collagenilyticus]
MIFQSRFYKDKKVLVVDDFEPIRSAVKGMLQKIGFSHIVSAGNGNDAVEKCEQNVFDFILADFNLGEGKDGYQLFEELRHKELITPKCCFFIISGESRRQIVHGLIELQPDDYLLKPFTYSGVERRLARSFLKKKAMEPVYEAIFEGDIEKAIQACEDVKEAEPEYGMHALRLKGELLIRNKQFEDAFKLYTAILTKRDFTWAKLGQGIARLNLEQWDEAEFTLRELCEVQETKVEALDWLGRLLIKREQTIEAHSVLTEAGKLSPRNIDRQRAIANLCIVNGETEEAVRCFSRILKSQRFSIYDTPDNYLNFARCLIDLSQESNKLEMARQIGQAMEVLGNIGKRFYTEIIKHQELVIHSRASAMKGDMEEARSQLEESERLMEEDGIESGDLSAESCLDKAKAFFATGDLSKSDEYMAQLENISDKDDLLSSTLTLLINKEKESHEELRENIRNLNNQGLTAYQNGSFQTAMTHFKEAFKYMPSNSSLALNLVQSIVKAGATDTESVKLAKRCADIIEKSELSESNTRRYLLIMEELHTLIS